MHVVYKRAEENISDAQVKSQIDALNRTLDIKALGYDYASTTAHAGTS